jgi:ABC-type antimicrobial peptide transport system permease subunit
MLKTYFKIAWRNLIKDRQFTALNLIGLSTGLACSLLIYMWIADEMNVDKFNENDSRIYKVLSNVKGKEGTHTMTSTAGLLGKVLEEQVPEIERSVSILPASWFSSMGIITVGNKMIKAGGQYVSKSYFDVFTCKFLEGDRRQIFNGTNSIAISQSLAKKLFGSGENVVGKTMLWNQDDFSGTFAISGVFEDVPGNATEKFDVLLNYDLVLKGRPNLLDWGNSDPHTYVLLKDDADVSKVNSKITAIIQKHHKEEGKTAFLALFSDGYLYGKYENGVQSGGRITYVRLFSIIAIVILIIACINFMNLSTAKASRRMKEVGIKKVSGASRTELVVQYLSESVLMSCLSLILAIGLIFLLLPVFNDVTGKQLSMNFSNELILSILAITLLTGLVSGSYPAFYLSGFSPVSVLKGKLKTTGGELFIRKGLVIFQFTLSVIFIATVLVVYKQIDYIQSRNLGYSRDNTIHFEIPLEMDLTKMDGAVSFVNELNNLPGVISAGSYSHNLIGDHGSIGGFQWPGKDPEKDIDFANLEVGANFLETAGIEIKEGRNFSVENAMQEIVFNESAIKEMGLKDPIGKKVKFWDRERTIVGIAKDFNFESLYSSVKPCFFQVYPVMPNVLVKMQAGTEEQTIERVKQVYSEFSKTLPFEYRFLDDDYQALYSSEMKIGLLSRYFALMAIIVSCLGLFGLAAFTAQKRQKEIGIRKVVGATVNNVIMMLSADFIKLIIVSIVIAMPVSWFLMNKWLEGFAYRADISLWLFAMIGVVVIVIAFATISFQAIKAAVMNPVKSLRSE